MPTRLCKVCLQPITAERLKALPETRTCLDHSDEQRKLGFMSWQHKTAPEFQLVTPQQAADIQRYKRKGHHAQLPVANKNNPWMLKSLESVDLSKHAPIIPAPMIEYDVVVSTAPMSRCHPDRPRVNSSGKCVECAVEWYRKRLK